VSGERAVVGRSETNTRPAYPSFRRKSTISAPIHFVFSKMTLEFDYYDFRHTISSNGRVCASFGKVGQSSGKCAKVQRPRPWYSSFKPDPNWSINDLATTLRSFRECPTRPATFDIFNLDPMRNHRNTYFDRPASTAGEVFRKVGQSLGMWTKVKGAWPWYSTLQTRTQSVEPSLRYDPMTFLGGGCRESLGPKKNGRGRYL
jgi:hypothetical protein